MDTPTSEASNFLENYIDKIKAIVTGNDSRHENENFTESVDLNRSSPHQKLGADPLAVLQSHQKSSNKSLTLDEAVSLLLLQRSLEVAGELDTDYLVGAVEDSDAGVSQCGSETGKTKV